MAFNTVFPEEGVEETSLSKGVFDAGKEQNLGLSPEGAEKFARRVQFAKKGNLGEDPDPEVVSAYQEGEEKEKVKVPLAAERDTADFDERVKLINRLALHEGSSEDINSVLQFQSGRDPETIVEKEYGERVAQTIFNGLNRNIKKNVSEEAIHYGLDVTKELVAKTTVAKEYLEKIKSVREDRSYLRASGDLLRGMVPFRDSVRLNNVVKRLNDSAVLKGTEMREQVAYMLSLSPAEFRKKAEEVYKELGDDMFLAEQFFSAILKYSHTDAFIDSAFDVLDSTIVVTPGLAAAKGIARKAKAVKELSQFKKALKDSAKSIIKDDDKEDFLEKVLEKMGKTEEVADLTVVRRMLHRRKAEGKLRDADNFDDLVKEAASAYRVDSMINETTNLSGEAVRRLKIAVADVLTGPQISRLETDDAIQKALEIAKEKVAGQRKHMDEGLLDFDYTPSDKSITNTMSMTMKFGNTKTAGLFESEASARYWGNMIYKFKDKFDIGQQGDGFFIKITKDIDESDNAIKNVLLPTENKTPRSVWNRWLGNVRSADDVTSKVNTADRKLLTYRPNEIEALLKAQVEHLINPLRGKKKKLSELERFINHYKVTPSKRGDGSVGKTFYNDEELIDAWRDFFGKAPSQDLIDAYNGMTLINDMDYVFRNINVYKTLVRNGIERISLKYGKGFSDEFNGKLVDDIAWEDGNTSGILYYKDSKAPTSSIFLTKSSSKNADTLKEIKEGISNGKLKVIKVFDPVNKPLKEIVDNGETINYVVTPSYRSSRQPIKQIPYEEGGHIIYKDEFYLKQPIVRNSSFGRRLYEGDLTLHGVSTKAEGRVFVEALNKARLMVKEGVDDDILEAFLERNLPYTVKEWKGLFKRDYNINEPFVLLGRNRNAYDEMKMKGEGIVDMARSSDNMAREVDSAFLQDKNALIPSLRTRRGDEGRPEFFKDSPRLVDPMSAAVKSLNSIVRSQLFEDYRIKTINEFIEDFGDTVFKGVTKEQLRKNPLAHLFNPQWDDSIGSKGELAVAKAAHKKIMTFLGQKTAGEQLIQHAKRQMLSFVYNKTNSSFAAEMVDDKLLSKIKDPATFMRAAAFHMKLGAFNPVQLWLQGQTFAHATAIVGPKIGLAAAKDAVVMDKLLLREWAADKAFLRNFVKKLDVDNPDEFMARYQALKNSGIQHIGGEVANLDDALRTNFFKSRAGNVLDAGLLFFRAGERFTRITAFNAAYREWQLANKGLKVSDRAMRDIIARTDLLSVNMTRASNASWQRGFASIPTQFAAFHVRLIEQMLGKRLTWKEKIRLLGTYATLYGIPTAAGIGTGTAALWPAGESLKTKLIEYGIPYDENVVTRLMTDGFWDLAVNLVLGKDYNFTERYGPTGNPQLKDALYGDKDLIDVFGGPSVSTLRNVMKSTKPILWAISGAFHGDEESPYTPSKEDFLAVFKEISTVNNFAKFMYMVNTHRYLTSSQTYVDDADINDALAKLIAGLQRQEITDMYRKSELLKRRNEFVKEASVDISKFLKLGLRAEHEKDRVTYWNKGFAHAKMAGLTPDEMSRLWQRLTKDSTPLLEILDERFRKNYFGPKVGDK